MCVGLHGVFVTLIVSVHGVTLFSLFTRGGSKTEGKLFPANTPMSATLNKIVQDDSSIL